MQDGLFFWVKLNDEEWQPAQRFFASVDSITWVVLGFDGVLESVREVGEQITPPA